jgi:hypothetical protein
MTKVLIRKRAPGKDSPKRRLWIYLLSSVRRSRNTRLDVRLRRSAVSLIKAVDDTDRQASHAQLKGIHNFMRCPQEIEVCVLVAQAHGLPQNRARTGEFSPDSRTDSRRFFLPRLAQPTLATFHSICRNEMDTVLTPSHCRQERRSHPHSKTLLFGDQEIDSGVPAFVPPLPATSPGRNHVYGLAVLLGSDTGGTTASQLGAPLTEPPLTEPTTP